VVERAGISLAAISTISEWSRIAVSLPHSEETISPMANKSDAQKLFVVFEVAEKDDLLFKYLESIGEAEVAKSLKAAMPALRKFLMAFKEMGFFPENVAEVSERQLSEIESNLTSEELSSLEFLTDAGPRIFLVTEALQRSNSEQCTLALEKATLMIVETEELMKSQVSSEKRNRLRQNLEELQKIKTELLKLKEGRL
jgi:hypothetical protein